MKAKVKSDTLFKLQPVLSSELTDAEKRFVQEGSEYDVKSFTEAENKHLRLELEEAESTNWRGLPWYVRKTDINIVGSDVTVKTVRDTLFKQRPFLASELADPEKMFVAAGSRFELQSFVPGPGRYTQLTLAETQLEPQQLSTWYARAEDIEISGQKIILKIENDTLFKARLARSSQLSVAEKELVPKHTAFTIQSYAEVEGNYLKITLAETALGSDDRITWYAFAPDVAIVGTEPNNRPDDTNPASKIQSSDRGKPLNLPGFQGFYYTHMPILASGYFTWGQATHDGSRLPVSTEVVYGIIRIAEAMEEIRSLFGNPTIAIKSWYRDPATNLRVGGASKSRHINGDAVDFTVEGYHPHDVYSRLDSWWGDRGGLASSSQFVHIDARGYCARWDYGF